MAEYTLTLYEPDDATPALEFGTAPEHVRPWLQLPDTYGEADISLLEGKARIGRLNLRLVDPKSGATHADRALTALLGDPDGQSVFNGRRAVFAMVDPAVVIIDGMCAGVNLDSLAVFSVAVEDIRARGIEVPLFNRTGTTTVLPRGVLDGYGQLPTGDWLVPPTIPLLGRYRSLGSDQGLIEFDDNLKPLEARILTDAMRQAVRFVFDTDQQRLIYPDVEVWWRELGTVPWLIHSRMETPRYTAGSSPDEVLKLGADLFATVPGQFQIPGGTKHSVDYVSRVFLRGTAAQPTLPDENALVQVKVVYVGPASEQLPFHFEGLAGELMLSILRGDSSTDERGVAINPRLRYDEAQLVGPGAPPALQAPVRVRITKPVDDLRAWFEKTCKALGVVPALNAAGEISPVSVSLPDESVILPEINDGNAEIVPGWGQGTSDSVTRVEVTYHRDFRVPVQKDPLGERSAVDGIASMEQAVTVDPLDPAIHATIGVKPLVIDAFLWRAIGGEDGQKPIAELVDEAGYQHAQRHGSQLILRFALGGQSSFVRVSRADPALNGRRAGDWVIDARGWAPNYTTGQRGRNHLAQIVSIRDIGPLWREMRLVDAAPHANPVAQPALGTVTVGSDQVVAVPVASVPADGQVRVDYAISDTLPPTVDSSWTFLGQTASVATLLSPPIPPGSIVWIRARGEKVGRRSSAWTNAVSITVPGEPRIVRAYLRIDGTSVVVEGQGNAETLGVRIYYTLHEAGTEPGDLIDFQDFDALEDSWVLQGVELPPSMSITLEVEPWTGWDGAAVTGTEGPRVRLARLAVDVAEPFPPTATITLESETSSAETLRYAGAIGRGGALPLEYRRRIADGAPSEWAILPVGGLTEVISRQDKTRTVSLEVRDAGGLVSPETSYAVAGFVSDIPAVSITFNASNEVIVTVSGHPFATDHFITVGENADPADPTTAAFDGVIDARSGTVNTGVPVAQGSVAHVKVLTRRTDGALGDVALWLAKNVSGGAITASITFNSANEVVVTANGPASTANLYVTAAEDADPADPTPAVNDGVIAGRSGTVNTGVVVTEGSVAFVRIVAEDGGGGLSAVVAFSAANSAAKAAPVAYIRITAQTDTSATVEYSGSDGSEGRSVAVQYQRQIIGVDRNGVVTTGAMSSWSATLPDTEVIARRVGLTQTVSVWTRDAENRESSAAAVVIAAAPDHVLALNDFTETEESAQVRWDWTPGAAVREVWVYWNDYPADAVPANPWPNQQPDRSPNLILPAATTFLERPKPAEGTATLIQFEPRDDDFPPRAGVIQRARMKGLAPSLPTVQYIGQAPATNPAPARTNVVAVVADRLSRPGRVYAWVNRSGIDEPAPTGVADGYIDVTLTNGLRSLSAADVWTLAGGGTANLFRDLPLHAQYGKRIWLRFDLDAGPSSGQVSELLRTWHQIIVGATGAWVEQIVTEAAIAHRAIGTLQLKLAGVARDNLVAKVVNAALLDDNILDLTEFNRVVLPDSIAASRLAVNELSEIAPDAGIIVSGELRNAAGTRYINLDAAGTSPFIAHDKFTLRANGSAEFGGTITSSATVTGRIIVAGNLADGAVDVGTVIADGIITAVKLNIVTISEISTGLGVMLRGVLRNSGNTAGIRLDAADALGSWGSHLDLAATGSMPVLKTPNVQLRANGSLTLGSHLTIDTSGNAIFSGALSAATGSFAGSLSAATGTFVGTVSIGPTTNYTAGYDPSTKETPAGAQAKADAAVVTASSRLSANVRSASAPTTRADGSALVAGDQWTETDNGNKPYVWSGSAWVAEYTTIDGGAIKTGAIRSIIYTPGSAGWSIDTDGTVEFNSGTFRGTIFAAAGEFAGQLTAQIVDVSRGGDLVLRPEGFFTGGRVQWRGNGDTVLASMAASNVVPGALGDVTLECAEFLVSKDGVTALRVRNDIVSGQTALIVRMITPAGGEISRTVQVGGPDSHAPGFRALYVSN